MDRSNVLNARRVAGGDPLDKIRKLLDYTDRPGQDVADQAGMQSPDDALSPDGEQTSPAIEERVFSERVAYGDVRHMSKNFYKGLIASVVVVVIIVAVIVILGRTAL